MRLDYWREISSEEAQKFCQITYPPPPKKINLGNDDNIMEIIRGYLFSFHSIIISFFFIQTHLSQFGDISVMRTLLHNYRNSFYIWIGKFLLQGDQLYMAVFFWNLVKRNLFSVRYCIAAYNSATFYKEPEQHDHVYLVGL